jgi:hypothetical protein
MPKIKWNDFATAYPSAPGYVAHVSSKLPKGPHFDRNKKKLPTPYGLFQEWAKQSLKGDWSGITHLGGFTVRIADPADQTIILNSWPAMGPAKKAPQAPQVTQINYCDRSYEDLARKLDYAI